jgi:twitching motility protein PilT
MEGVFCQQLLPLAVGKGRVMSSEIMIPHDAIRANIRDDKVHQIYSTIQTGNKTGMRTMNQSLLELYKAGKISYDVALQYTHNLEDMKKTFQVA